RRVSPPFPSVTAMSITLFTSGEQAGQNVISVARHPFLIRRTKRSTWAPHVSQERLWISLTQPMSFRTKMARALLWM
ncbi:MAG: hypothetical protein V3S55_03590, partial [Nitrospiraceae bacterium]